MRAMILEVWRIYFVCDFETSLVEDFFKHSSGYDLVSRFYCRSRLGLGLGEQWGSGQENTYDEILEEHRILPSEAKFVLRLGIAHDLFFYV